MAFGAAMIEPSDGRAQAAAAAFDAPLAASGGRRGGIELAAPVRYTGSAALGKLGNGHPPGLGRHPSPEKLNKIMGL
jgi:hypothetical protein